MTETSPQSVTPSLSYRDPRAAIDWLEKAFGFERAFVVVDDAGAVGHAELRHGDGVIMLGGEWSDDIRSPATLGGKTTQVISVTLAAGIDAHCAKARAAGAHILQDPEEQFYGARTYRARDPEGHIWTFRQNTRALSIAEMEKASGLKFEMPR
ncbi:MAG: VOC family protein [Parvularculaceae bacterium]|nr:VOC family protein [Parvularculaceae bacterium]